MEFALNPITDKNEIIDILGNWLKEEIIKVLS